MMPPALPYFLTFLKASFLSTGGTGNLPILHADLTAHHWASEQQFTQSLTIGQITPGPTGLWVLSLGYLTAGLTGSLIALLAIMLPPMAILLIRHFYLRLQGRPEVDGFVRGMGLAVSGLLITTLVRLLASTGVDLMAIAIIIATLALAWWRKLPAICIILAAAALGIVHYR
jgi:chromate transporter